MKLPVIGQSRGRSAMTCIYRCGNACAHEAPNESNNPYLGDILEEAISRRTMLKGAAGAALVVYAGSKLNLEGTALAADGSGLTFTKIEPNTVDDIIVPNGYDYELLIRWGDPLFKDAPEFDFENQTERAQKKQFGYNNDYVTFLPLGRDRRGRAHGLMVVNHEYTNEELMFRSYDPLSSSSAELEKARVAMAAHGMSVFEVVKKPGTGAYRVKKSSHFNRRVTAETKMRLTGPAAGHDWLKTSADPTGTVVRGTLNNCAGGTTPWGTVLSGEENFNQYFINAAGAGDDAKRAAYKRYGFGDSTPSFGYRGWERLDPRFDLSKEPNEGFRFGYVVEIDPFDPEHVPAKRTALGRFKHEGAETALTSDGRPVVYMGDDERFDYAYKFVGSKAMKKGTGPAARKHNLSLLDEGTLYVARFTGDSPPSEITGDGQLPSDGEFDGTGEWIPLVSGSTSFVEGMTAAEVLIRTREAGDKVGATKMDRPEDFEPNPVTGRVYLALTNNSRRGATGSPGVDEANPRTGNKHGHVIEIDEAGNDPSALTFNWRIFIVCGDPEDPSTYFAGFDKSQVSPISAPDNLFFDKPGNLWITTDGNALGFHDGFFATPVVGAERGHLKMFLTVPKGAEATGPMITPDQKTLFVAAQHPGENDGASPDNRFSTWPDGGQPRPSVAAVYRDAKEGSKTIGS